MGSKLEYQPALDGTRAVSIALVLAFHLNTPGLGGGYLGVSVFFTLSGFLITSLLLSERERSGRIDVRAFYVRRLRRLLPASLVCLTGIALFAASGVVAERTDLRTGVLGAALQVGNWVSLLGDRSYADLFLAPSPVDHFWSLAIEEQFYWVWPLVIAALTGLVAKRRNRHRIMAVTLTGMFVALSASAFVTASTLGGDAAYFASWARFAEIIAGAALAAVLANRSLPTRVAHAALPCLVAIIVLSVVTPAGRGWAYAGGLPLFALLTVGLIAGVQVDGPVRTWLGHPALAATGRVSYGLYLFHWPVFTILDADRIGTSGVPLAIIRLAVTVSITLVSYHLVERPIRTRRVLGDAAHYIVGASATFAAVVVLIAVSIPVLHREHRSTEPVVINAALANGVAPITTNVPPAPPATTAPAATAPVRTGAAAVAIELPATTTTQVPRAARVVALFGDSIADWLLHDAAPTFARTDITLVDVAVEGCDGAASIPLARSRDLILPLPDDCKPWPDSYPAAAENPALPLDVAVLMLGNAPMVDHQVGGRWISPCDSMDWYVADLAERVDYLRHHAGDVVLALPAWGGDKASYFSGNDHLERMGCIRTALTAMAAKIDLEIVDLADILCPAGPDGDCTDRRENDGLHTDSEDAPAVLDWLLDALGP